MNSQSSRCYTYFFRYQYFQLFLSRTQNKDRTSVLTLCRNIKQMHLDCSWGLIYYLYNQTSFIESIDFQFLVLTRQILSLKGQLNPMDGMRIQSLLVFISNRLHTCAVPAIWKTLHHRIYIHPEVIVRSLRIWYLDSALLHHLRQTLYHFSFDQDPFCTLLSESSCFSRKTCQLLITQMKHQSIIPEMFHLKWSSKEYGALTKTETRLSKLAWSENLLYTLYTKKGLIMTISHPQSIGLSLCHRYFRFLFRRLGWSYSSLLYLISHICCPFYNIWSIVFDRLEIRSYIWTNPFHMRNLKLRWFTSQILGSVNKLIYVFSCYGLCTCKGYPLIHYSWLHNQDLEILQQFMLVYNQSHTLYTGVVNYDVIVHYISHILSYVCVKTLAFKHKTKTGSMRHLTVFLYDPLMIRESNQPTWTLK